MKRLIDAQELTEIIIAHLVKEGKKPIVNKRGNCTVYFENAARDLRAIVEIE